MYTHAQGNIKVIPQHAIRAYGRMKLELRPFLTSAIGGSNWTALCSGHITLENEHRYVELWECPLGQCGKSREWTDPFLLPTIEPGFVASFPHILVSLILSV